MDRDLSIYLHFPFCRSKCPYCDFYSAPAEELGIDPVDYMALVERELERVVIEQPNLEGRSIVSLYIGGGTPSLGEPEWYAAFRERLARHFPFAPDFEWTIEANPGAATPEKIAGFLSIGVNRFSIGVQSFCDSTLAALGRCHTSDEARKLIELVRNAGEGCAWGIDLIFAAPDQTLQQWVADLEEAVEFRPHHLSVYEVTVHEGTPFALREARGGLRLPDEEIRRLMFSEARKRLLYNEYIHYEISNFALSGYEGRHNRRYWTGQDYLGIGVSAHSFLRRRRWANPPDIALYRRALERARLPRLIESPPVGRSATGEWLMLGLRQLEGFPLSDFETRFGRRFLDAYGREVKRLVEGGWVELAGDRFRLTEAGLFVADAVMAEFF
jgi:oxygen-independent coproporphyrinogen-3 oxidase